MAHTHDAGPKISHIDDFSGAAADHLNVDGAYDSESIPDSIPPSPRIMSRSQSFSSSVCQDQEEMESVPPLDRLTIFDFLENLALPQRLEKIHTRISAQTERVKKQQGAARRRVVDEWRKRLPPPDEQYDKYRKRVKGSVDKLGKRWSDSKNVTTREKLSFIAGVLNIFISGYLVGAFPNYYHIWYTAQLSYFYPIRFYTYHKRGYHYFLVDMCYFVNFLLILSMWVFPNSKRLFISTFCLAFGNNAIAIAMWRNSLVFHSLDKVTSLFIHIMPCVTIHCMVHLLTPEQQAARFPAIYSIKHSLPSDPGHYSLASMIVWSTAPYALWQLSYHFLITVRRRDKIAAGRPTSFTWLRRSYKNTMLGKIVLALPESLQEPAFMLIQYLYALLTMMPCPIWFWYRWPSALFLMSVFTWSVYNGAVFYIDIFGQRFQKELDALKRDVARYQVGSPEIAELGKGGKGTPSSLNLGAAAVGPDDGAKDGAAGGEGAEASRQSSGVGESVRSCDEHNAAQQAAGSSTGREQITRNNENMRERGSHGGVTQG